MAPQLVILEKKSKVCSESEDKELKRKKIQKKNNNKNNLISKDILTYPHFIYHNEQLIMGLSQEQDPYNFNENGYLYGASCSIYSKKIVNKSKLL